MIIKHMPNGLFPNEDSGFERHPLLPLAGTSVRLDCRLSDAPADAELWLYWCEAGKELLSQKADAPTLRKDGHSFYSFSLLLPASPVLLEYHFLARDSSGGSVETGLYRLETLREIRLTTPDSLELSEHGLCAGYHAGGYTYCLRVEADRQIRLLLEQTDDKPVTSGGFTLPKTALPLSDSWQMLVCKPFALDLQHFGETVAQYGCEFCLLTDRNGQVYEATHHITLTAQGLYGFGEKFDRVNQNGLSPLSSVVEKYTNQRENSYFPVPFFFTDRGVGFFREGSYRTQFLLGEHPADGVTQATLVNRTPRRGVLLEEYLFTGVPSAILQQLAQRTGMPALPPKWAFGPWMSSNGWNTQSEALEQVERMNTLAIPATVMVLEAWSDEETFYIWNDAQYTPRDDGSPFSYGDFTFPPHGKWPNPKGFTDLLADNGIKLILWQIPVVKHDEATQGRQLMLDIDYADEHGLCIKNADGSPYRVTEKWFANSRMPDFTNPATVKWWFDKRRYLVSELGVAGFKTDGGEFLFDDTARLFDGADGEQAHNSYPNSYVGAYHAFLEDTAGKGKGVTFSRAGYTGGQKFPMHWAGDQVSSWSELRGQLTAGLSLGLSGVPFWGFDIGGFADVMPTAELYLRAAAFAAFAPVMQFHSEPRSGQFYITEREHWNNDRSPWNVARISGDEHVIPAYRLFANLRMNLLPYLYNEARNCAQTARPMMAHLIYDYQQDKMALEIEDEYMLGRDILVAPVITQGATTRTLYLPYGGWYELWSGQRVDGGREVTVDCGLTELPVYLREGAAIPLNLNRSLRVGGTEPESSMPNAIDRYEELCILTCGDSGIEFSDDLGFDIRLQRNGDICTVAGKLPHSLTVLLLGAAAERVAIDGAQPVSAELFGKPCRGLKLIAD